MNSICHSSYLEVDLGALRSNIGRVQAHLRGRCGMIPVVKANAYAMGMERVTRLLTDEFGFDFVAVAQVCEGLRLRKNGFKCGVLVMGGSPPGAIAAAVENGLTLTVFTAEAAEEASRAARRAGVTVNVHVKLETGMNRLGVRVGDGLDTLLHKIKELVNLRVSGVFTHFATSNYFNDPNTLAQYELFRQGVEQVRSAGIRPEYIHCCNSGATTWLEQSFELCTHVRPASVFMGYDMMADGSNPLNVREAASWRAFITNVHEVFPGDAVGYGRHFEPPERMTVATVGIGYADGLFRPAAQSGGPVLVNDTRTRYLATCMDQCFVDVTGIPCRIGDEITVLGYSRGGELLSVFELEKYTGQCYQNSLCQIGDRVARVYVG